MSRKKDIERYQRERAELLRKKALLTFECSEEEFRNFDQPDDEATCTIPFIKKYLLTEVQRAEMFRRNISIEEILNGRVEYKGVNADYDAYTRELFNDWNRKLGYTWFGN